MQILPELQTSMTPEGFKNFEKHVFMPLMIEDPSLIEVMFPKSIEEIKAEAENDMLKKEELPQVADTDDHEAHIYTHMMVQPKTWATWIHIQQHEEALAKQKAQMQQQAMLDSVQQQGATSSGPMPSNSSQAAAAPLKAAAATPTNI